MYSLLDPQLRQIPHCITASVFELAEFVRRWLPWGPDFAVHCAEAGLRTDRYPHELGALGCIGSAKGEDRQVLFHSSGWCLKFPLPCPRHDANKAELEFLADVPVDDRKYFAETYLLPNNILLQRTYEVDRPPYNRYAAAASDIMRAQRRLLVPDVHPCNVGWTEDGHFVFIDWAGGMSQTLRARLRDTL